MDKLCTAMRSIDAEFPDLNIPEAYFCEIEHLNVAHKLHKD